ncbi:MAG: helix-turn-helix transcriptional regulator [Ruminococcus sp.]|nr:helix-turn-helix transcriptional regulator [Ruminococcus sp.]
MMKKRRKELGFRQEDVAEEAGITVQHYQNL